MSKTTQLSTSNIQALTINGSPNQIQRIVSNWDKNNIELNVFINGKLLGWQRKRTNTESIKIELSSINKITCPKTWKATEIKLEFITNSKNAHMAITPLINNGMKITAGHHFTLSKKCIEINQAL